MQRYQIEEAVEKAKHLVHTLRGVEGLIGVCETALNATQVIDGLKDQQDKLVAEIANTKKATEEAVHEQEKTLEKTKREHDKVKGEILGDIKNLALRRDKLNAEYEKAKAEHGVKMAQLKQELDDWMADCAAKQRVANDHLVALNAQIDAILASRGK